MVIMEHELEDTRCNLCGSDKFEVLFYAVDPYGDSDRAPYRVVKCRACCLGYLNPRVPERHIGAYYPSEIYLLKVGDGAAPPGLVGRAERFYQSHGFGYQVRQSLRWAGRLGISVRSVFDIGCGPGDRLLLYRGLGIQTAGLEFSPDADYARERYGLDVFRGTLEDYLASGTGRTYDMVTWYNVLEHLYDPLGSLVQAGSLLAPGGMLVLTVPNLGSVQARVFRGRWAASREVPRHTYFFDRRTLGAMLEKAGYEVSGLTTMASFWHPPTLVLSLLPGLDPRFSWRDDRGKGGLIPLVRRAAWVAATLALAPPAYAESVSGLGAQLTAFAVKKG